MPIEITVVEENLQQKFSTTEVDLYLVDRTSESLIILAIDKNNPNFYNLEIPKSQIISMKYLSRKP